MSPKNKREAKRVISYYWRKVTRYPTALFFIGITVPLAQLSNNIVPPLILARVLDRLGRHDYVVDQPWQSFGTEMILYAIIALSAGSLFWRLVDAFVWRLEGNITRDLAQHVYKHLIDQSADFHANNFGGSLVSQNNKLLGSYMRLADTTIYGILPLTATILAAAIILFGKVPLYAIGLVLFSIFYLFASYKMSTPAREAGSKHSIAESKQTGYLADSVTNVMVIKSFATNNAEFERFTKVTDKTYASLMNLMRKNQRQMFYFTSLTSTINIASMFAAIISVVSLNANIATAFLIFNYTANIIGQLFQFSNTALRNYNRAVGDASEMVNILNTPAEVQDPVNPEESKMHRGSIRLRDVTFTHKDANQAIFSHLNLHIKPGEKVGLVGHSGSGKTTLTRLLLRFSDVDSGVIEIDGQNITSVTQDDLHRAIAYVPQEPLLFHRTIAENIGYSDPNATQQQIAAIAKQANAAEFIEKLPHKYQTLVGERGIKLSGGQRQRVAIARAMLKNAPILILDEATSALDSESEGLIQDALWKLMEGRTAIVIAHRLSTIQRMDRILVMDDGGIIEEGSHKDLLYKKGIYAALWNRQSGGFIEE
jgi:ATP-binding cassette, subfamily B, bacterial